MKIFEVIEKAVYRAEQKVKKINPESITRRASRCLHPQLKVAAHGLLPGVPLPMERTVPAAKPASGQHEASLRQAKEDVDNSYGRFVGASKFCDVPAASEVLNDTVVASPG